MASLDVGLVIENELLNFCAVQSAFCTSFLGLPSALNISSAYHHDTNDGDDSSSSSGGGGGGGGGSRWALE